MRHIKLFKLANFIEKYSYHEANLIRKIASEEAFASMVLGSYPAYSSNENESKLRKKRVIFEIKNNDKPQYSYATIKRLAEIINKNDVIKNSIEDHVGFWKQKSDDTTSGLDPLQIVEFTEALSSASPTPSSYSGAEPREERGRESGRYQTDYASRLANVIERYQRLMRDISAACRALGKPKSILIPTTSGNNMPGYLEQYNPQTKEGLFVFGTSIESWQTKIVLDKTMPLGLEILSLNNKYSRIQSIKAAELNSLFLIPPLPKINVPSGSGDMSEGMIISHGYERGMGFTVVVTFSNGTLRKTFNEADGSLSDFIVANPDLMNFIPTR